MICDQATIFKQRALWPSTDLNSIPPFMQCAASQVDARYSLYMRLVKNPLHLVSCALCLLRVAKLGLTKNEVGGAPY